MPAQNSSIRADSALTGGDLPFLREGSANELVHGERTFILEFEKAQTEVPALAESFYPEFSPVRRASDLLEQSIETLGKVRSAIETEDYLEADLLAQGLLPLWQKIFEFPSFGEGFQIAVNSIWCAIENFSDNFPTAAQIVALTRVISEVRTSPFIGVDAAVGLNERLDEAGFRPDIIALEGLSDIAQQHGERDWPEGTAEK